MPARSARTRRRADEAHTDSASRDAAEAALNGAAQDAASDTDAPETGAAEAGAAEAGASGKKSKADRDGRGGKKALKGGKKAAIASNAARLDTLEHTVADLTERLDALTRIVDEAMKASVTPRPKATEVVPRNRPRKA